MDLNLKNKGVIINLDNIGIHQHITKRLNTEGAVPIIKNKQNDYEKLYNKTVKLNALINIKENCKAENDNSFLQSFYNEDYLADHFTVINIGTRNALSIETNSYKNDVLKTANNAQPFKSEMNIKSINIVYPDPPKVSGNTSFSTEEYTRFTNQQIVNSVAFFISMRGNLTNGQIIFIDHGLHLLQSASINCNAD